MYLKCETADCKGTAQIDQGLLVQYMQIPRRPIYCQNPLLADPITCKFIQPFISPSVIDLRSGTGQTDGRTD